MFCTGLAFGQSKNVEFYVNSAIQNDPTLHSERNSVLSTQVNRKVIKAKLSAPKVTGTGDYLWAPVFNGIGYDPAVSNGGLYDALVNVKYPILNGVELKTNLKQNAITTNINRNNITMYKHQLHRKVADQYVVCYQDQAQIGYTKRILTLLKEQKSLLKSLVGQGLIPQTNIKQLDIEIEKNQANLSDYKGSYKNDLATLNVMCGLNDTSMIRLPKPDIHLEHKISRRMSSFYKQFKLDSLNLKYAEKVKELKYLPKVSLLGSAGLNSSNFANIQHKYGFSVGVNVSIDIFDGNQRKLNRQITKINQNSISGYEQRLKLNRGLKLEKILRQLSLLRNKQMLIKKQLSNYQTLLNSYRKELTNGQITVIDYVTTLRNYINTQNEWVTVQTQRFQLINAYNYWNW